MTLLGFALVGFGGALGAMARHAAGFAAARLVGTAFPWGTLAINLVGSVLMGVLVGLLARHAPPWAEEARLLLGVGVLGGFTTFSAFSLEIVVLAERGAALAALLYVLASVALGVAGLYLGLLAMRGI